MKPTIYDVAVIGAGICGASVAYELAQYDLSVCVLERETDIAMGTTKANSAIVHAGYDPEPGTLMAKYNVAGAKRIKELAEKLAFSYRQIGSLVLAFSDAEMETLRVLYERGLDNGVEGLEVLDARQVLSIEPQLSTEVKGALLAPSAGVVSPWGMTLALLETAVRNGCEVMLESEVTGLRYDGGVYQVQVNGEDVLQARFLVNAAGVYADRIQQFAGESEFTITPYKGQYYLLDKSQADVVHHVMFQCPTEQGKGILVSPTAGGNLIVGPDSQKVADKEDLSTDPQRLALVQQAARKTTEQIEYRENVRSFAGLRAYSDRPDFIVEPSTSAPQLINLAGIKSPGLTAAPAIAPDVVAMLGEMGLALTKKKEIVDTRRWITFSKLSAEQRSEAIKEDPAFGRVVCRCNTVTEGEILRALESPIPPKTIDGIKRRCGTGMGRCQGGFCAPKIHALIAAHRGLPMEKVELERKGSYIVTGRTKGKINV